MKGYNHGLEGNPMLISNSGQRQLLKQPTLLTWISCQQFSAEDIPPGSWWCWPGPGGWRSPLNGLAS